MRMRRVLVTGGAGFIGSHLCETLLQRGDEVFVLGDLSTGQIENIADLRNRKAFHFTLGSILDFPLLESLVKRTGLLLDMAAVVGVREISEVPVAALESDVLGDGNVLSMAG